MIRLFSFFIRAVLSLVIVVLGITFFGPYLVQCVDKWQGKVEDYPSFSEQFTAIDRVKELLKEKGISEVEFEDLLGAIHSDHSDEVNVALQLQVEQLGFSAAEVKVLGSLYQDLLKSERESAEDDEPSPPEQPGIRSSGSLTPSEGL